MVKAYEEFVAQSAMMPLDDLTYSVIGLCGEAGEVAEWFKKSVCRGNPKFGPEELKAELGDVLHYVTRIALNKGWGLKALMQGNMDKLIERRAHGKSEV